MAEVQSGFWSGPIDLDQVPHHVPLSKRFGIKQGVKTRCVDDFSRSGISSCAQVSESPKPHMVDIIASLGLSLMRHGREGASWKVRTYDLSGAYRQCAVHPDSLQFSYILVAVPGEDRSVAFQMRALPFGSVVQNTPSSELLTACGRSLLQNSLCHGPITLTTFCDLH